jgi:exodeoxyribonuclease III
MKIISWNVNGIRAWYKKENTLDWVLKQSPDFFCLQEIKAEKEQLPDELLEIDEYFAYFESSKTRKGYSGVAIYTKHEPERVETGLGIQALDQEGRFLALFYEGFVVINCYFPNGGMGGDAFSYKLNYYEAFLKYILKLQKKGYSIVFVGDVNVAHNEIDIARPKENKNSIGFLPVERDWMTNVIESGFIDSWRYQHPETVRYSWWDIKTRSRDRNVGWRIDYMFVSNDMKKNIKKTEIHNEVFGSDHCPVSLQIDL